MYNEYNFLTPKHKVILESFWISALFFDFIASILFWIFLSITEINWR